ncbi:Hypothetical predicted protein [Octopus vulgaris]|uniref:Uncharacterized protein n=1 Tax=Octopus vulgaris TaxID=6645 RepID=A0AA36BIA0_OCTVU|nr:Hypothetical predicted protein [Octopus vulgaris]
MKLIELSTPPTFIILRFPKERQFSSGIGVRLRRGDRGGESIPFKTTIRNNISYNGRVGVGVSDHIDVELVVIVQGQWCNEMGLQHSKANSRAKTNKIEFLSNVYKSYEMR